VAWCWKEFPAHPPGPIRLGALGGDRVILSRDLRDARVNLGRIEPYRRTYAKRPPKAPAPLGGGRSTRFAVERFLQESRTAPAPHHGWRIDP